MLHKQKNYLDKHTEWNSPIKNPFTTEIWGRFKRQPFGKLPNILDKTRQLFDKTKKKLTMEKWS